MGGTGVGDRTGDIDRKRQVEAVPALRCRGVRASIKEIGQPRAIRGPHEIADVALAAGEGQYVRERHERITFFRA